MFILRLVRFTTRIFRKMFLISNIIIKDVTYTLLLHIALIFSVLRRSIFVRGEDDEDDDQGKVTIFVMHLRVGRGDE